MKRLNQELGDSKERYVQDVEDTKRKFQKLMMENQGMGGELQ